MSSNMKSTSTIKGNKSVSHVNVVKITVCNGKLTEEKALEYALKLSTHPELYGYVESSTMCPSVLCSQFNTAETRAHERCVAEMQMIDDMRMRTEFIDRAKCWQLGSLYSKCLIWCFAGSIKNWHRVAKENMKKTKTYIEKTKKTKKIKKIKKKDNNLNTFIDAAKEASKLSKDATTKFDELIVLLESSAESVAKHVENQRKIDINLKNRIKTLKKKACKIKADNEDEKTEIEVLCDELISELSKYDKEKGGKNPSTYILVPKNTKDNTIELYLTSHRYDEAIKLHENRVKKLNEFIKEEPECYKRLVKIQNTSRYASNPISDIRINKYKERMAQAKSNLQKEKDNQIETKDAEAKAAAKAAIKAQ